MTTLKTMCCLIMASRMIFCKMQTKSTTEKLFIILSVWLFKIYISFLFDHRIEHTYERFLNDSKELRRMGNCNRSYTNANEQRNRSNQSISYGGGSGNVESTDISTHQPNLNSSLSNEKQTVWSREPNPQAIDGVSSSYISMSPSESSSTTESMGTRDIEQQSLGEVHEKLSVSFGQHSNTDYDLDDLNDVLDDLNCLDNKEMDLVVKGLASVAPADYSIIFANDESQTTNLEQGTLTNEHTN